MRIEFSVHGRIAGSGSKTAMPRRGKNTDPNKLMRPMMVPASKYSKPWMKLVATHAKLAYCGTLLTGPLCTRMNFIIERPNNHYGTGRNAGVLKDGAPAYPHQRAWPDLTKLCRATEDALEGIIFKNDKQVVEQHNTVMYGKPMGVIIIIDTLNKPIELIHMMNNML